MNTNTIKKFVICTLVYCHTVIGLKQSELLLADLPPECEEFLILDDSTRNVNHGFERVVYCI